MPDPTFTLPDPDFETDQPSKVWVVLEGEDAPPNTITTQTRYPHIRLAWRLEVNDGQERERLWDRANTETEEHPSYDSWSCYKAKTH